jgi:hypothetical protein
MGWASTGVAGGRNPFLVWLVLPAKSAFQLLSPGLLSSALFGLYLILQHLNLVNEHLDQIPEYIRSIGPFV